MQINPSVNVTEEVVTLTAGGGAHSHMGQQIGAVHQMIPEVIQ